MAWFYSKDVNLYYEDQGKGIPLIFIHPPVLTGINFKYQVEELSKEFRVIVPDLRGHGKSESSNRPFTYSLIVDDLKTMLKHLNIDKAVICGYSTGGSIALQFMVQEPEKVLGGVLLGGLSEVMEKDKRLKNYISLGAKTAEMGAGSTLAFTISYSNANNVSYFKELFREAKKGSPKKMQEYYEYSLTFNCTKELLTIQAPVLLLYGEKDKGFIPYCHLNQKYLPTSRIHYISGVKHQIPTKNYKEVNQRIKEFVQQEIHAH